MIRTIFKKSLLLLLILTMILSAVSCGNSEGAYKGELFDLYSDEGEALFRIIRARDADEETIALGVKIRDAVLDNLDLEIEYKPDAMKQQEGIYDISIGVTNRPESKKLYDKIKKNRKNSDLDYIIAVKNGVIYLVGGSIDGLTLAVEKFIAECCTTMNAYLSTEYYYSYEAGPSEPLVLGGKESDLTEYVIVRPRYNVSYLTTMETDKLIKAVKLLTGTELKVELDTKQASKYEIVIGNANRKGVPKIEDRDAYSILYKDNKIYLNGGHFYSTAMAVTEFISLVQNGGELKEGVAITGSYAKTLEDYDKTQYYTATLLDDFDGDTLNEKYWDARVNEGEPYAKGKSEIQPRNLSVRDGNLVMKGTKDGDNYYVGAGFTSSFKAWFLYGTFEMSAILPATNGFYTSFWVLGSDSDNPKCEFDIFEKFANNDQAIKHTLLNWPGGFNYKQEEQGFSKKTYVWLDEGEYWHDTYHTIGMVWTYDSVIFYTDGNKTYEAKFDNYPTRFGLSARKYAFMQGALGVNFLCHDLGPGVVANANGVMGIDHTTDWNHCEYKVDYMFAFQRQGEGGVKFR